MNEKYNEQLIEAVDQNSLEKVRTLLEEKKADPNYADGRRRTALHHACTEQKNLNIDIIKLLLKHGANTNVLTLGGRETPLHGICGSQWITGTPEMVEVLLEYGANIDAQSVEGRTPLIFACLNTNIELLDCLLKNKANPSLKDNKGKSALSYIVEEYSFAKAMQFGSTLINYGASVNGSEVEKNTTFYILNMYEFLKNKEVISSFQDLAEVFTFTFIKENFKYFPIKIQNEIKPLVKASSNTKFFPKEMEIKLVSHVIAAQLKLFSTEESKLLFEKIKDKYSKNNLENN